MNTFGVCLLFAAVLCAVEASHFRYGTLKYSNSGSTTTFTVDLAMRRSFFGAPSVGTNLGAVGTFYIGSSAYLTPNYYVTSMDTSNDIVYASAVFSYTFATVPASVYCYFYSSARIGNLNNNANGAFQFGTTITDRSTNAPVSGLLPIVSIPYGQVPYTFNVLASDIDGDALSYRLSTNSEMAGTNPTGLSVDSNGLVTISTVLNLGYWSTQQTITDSKGNSVSVDYLLNVEQPKKYCTGNCYATCSTDSQCSSCNAASTCKVAAPAIVTASSSASSNFVAPDDGSTVTVTAGQTTTIKFVAYDSFLQTSTINMYFGTTPSYVTVIPQTKCDSASGCTFTGGYSSPQLIGLTINPTASSVGSTATVCLGVTSNTNALSYSQHCVTLSVQSGSVCGNGAIEQGETCDGGDCCNTNCQYKSGSEVCRASNGVCDVAESCTGSSASCPADSFSSSSTVCRSSNGDCDVAESCTGSSASCPADSFASSSTVCRASNGVCDVAESCTGSSASCPADSFSSSSTVCRASNGVCDVAESCTGSSASCPADGFASSSTVCRASNGVCDVAESCTGSSVSCPADGFVSSSTVCRAAVNSCDVAESCTGSSASCPADALSQTATCFCPRQAGLDGPTPKYFCGPNGFYQCQGGPWAANSASMGCGAGTVCGCPPGVECSCNGRSSPCVTAGTQQVC